MRLLGANQRDDAQHADAQHLARVSTVHFKAGGHHERCDKQRRCRNAKNSAESQQQRLFAPQAFEQRDHSADGQPGRQLQQADLHSRLQGFIHADGK